MWGFPERGIPPGLILHLLKFIEGIFPYEPTMQGYPHLWKPPYMKITSFYSTMESFYIILPTMSTLHGT